MIDDEENQEDFEPQVTADDSDLDQSADQLLPRYDQQGNFVMPGQAPAPAPAPPPVDTSAPAPTPAPTTGSDQTTDQQTSFAPVRLPPGAVATGPPVSVSADAAPPPAAGQDEGYGSAVVGGAARAGTGILDDMTHVGAWLAKKVANWTDQQWLDHAADTADQWSDQLKEQTEKKYDLGGMSMKDAYDKGVIGPWIVSQAAEQGLSFGAIVGLEGLTGPMGPIVYGASVAAEREAEKPDSTNGSVGAAAAEGAVTMGLPIAAIKTAQGRSLVQKIVISALGMGSTNVVSSLADPLPHMVATGQYQAPSAEQVAQAGVTGLIGGAVAGPFIPRGHAEEAPAPTTGDADTDAAIKQAVPPAQPQQPTGTPADFTNPVFGPPAPPTGPDMTNRQTPFMPTAAGSEAGTTGSGPAAEPTGVNPIRARQQTLQDNTSPADFTAGGTAPEPVTPGPGRPIAPDAQAALDQSLGQPSGMPDRRAPFQPRPEPVEPTPAPQPPLTGGPADFTNPVQGPPAPGPEGPLADRRGPFQPTAPEAPPPEAPPVNPLRARQAGPDQGTRPSDFTVGETFGPPTPDTGEPLPDRRAAFQPAPEAEAPAETGYTTEPDHENPNQYVAKDSDGNVVAIGDTPEQAVRMAQARDAERAATGAGEAGAAATGAEEGATPAGIGGITAEEPAPEPKKPSPSARRKAKGAQLTEAADQVLDQAQQKLAAKKAATAPKAAEEGAATPELVRLVKKSQAAKAEAEGEAAPERETPTARAARIKAEVAEDLGETGEVPATAKPAARGMENIGDVSEAEAKQEAPTRTSDVTTTAEAEGREESGLKSEQRAASRTDLAGKASDLLHDVLEGDLDLGEADKRYGAQPAGPGRPRTHPRLLDYVKSRIKLASDPNALRDIVDRARRIENDKSLSKEDKLAAADKIGAEMERLSTEQDRLPELHDIQAQLEASARREAARAEGPAKPLTKAQQRVAAKEADRAARTARSDAAFEKMKAALADKGKHGMRPGLIARFQQAIGDRILRQETSREVQEPIFHLLDDGTTHDLHDYLDAISENPSARARTPHYAALAKVLKAILPRGIEVDAGDGSHYNDILDHITLDRDPLDHAGHAQVILHEALHAASVHYLNGIGARIEAGERVPFAERRHYDALQAIGDELRQHLENGRVTRLRARGEVPGAMSEAEAGGIDYGFSRKDNTELITEALTDPHVMQFMARTQASTRLTNRLRDLGFDTPPKSTLWNSFKNAIGNLFKLGMTRDSVLDRVLQPLTELAERGVQSRPAPFDPEGWREGISFFGDRASQDARALTRATSQRLTDALPDPQARQTFHDWGDRAYGFRLGKKGADDGFVDRVSKLMPDVDTARAFRSAALPSSTTNEIVNYNRDVLPQLTQMRDVRAKMQRTTNEVLSQWTDRVRGWAKQLQTAGSDFGQLMNDATMTQARLGRPDFEAANAHLKPDELATARELQGKWDDLSPDQKKLYLDIRDYQAKTGADERQAAFEHAIDMGLGGEDPITGKPFITPEERAELARVARSKTATDEMVNNPDASPLASMMGDRWVRARNMVKEITALRQRGWINGDYFDLGRTGDYIVSHGEPESENYGVRFFERKGEAQAWRDQFEQDNPTIPVSNVNLKPTTGSGDRMSGIIPDVVAARFDRALAARGLSGDQEALARDALNATFLQTFGNASGRFLQRRNVAGASTDRAQILTKNLNSHASRMGYLLNGAEEGRAYGDALRRVQALGQRRVKASAAEIAAGRDRLADLEARFKAGDPAVGAGEIADARQQQQWLEKPPTSAQQNRAVQAFNEMVSRRSPIDGDESTKWLGQQARRLNVGSFVYHLMRPAQMVMNSLDAYSNAQAFLGARYGHAQTAIALARGLRQLGPKGGMILTRNMMRAVRGELTQADWNISKVFEKRLVDSGFDRRYGDGAAARLMEAANQYGMIDVSRAREMLRMSRPGGFSTALNGVHKVGANMMDLFASGEHAVDAMNRVNILKSAFEMGMRSTKGDVDRSIASAVELAQRAMPNWSLWNKPRLATERGPLRSPLVSSIMQYKIYGMHLYSVMGSLTKQAMSSQVPGERAEAIKALVGLMATHSLLVGATANMFGVPINALTGIWDYFHGLPGPHDYETDLRRWMTANLGPTASTFLSRGALALAGIDAHRTLKLSNMVDIPEIRSFDRQGFTAALATAALGASGDTAEQIGASIHDMMSGGDMQKAVIGLLPRPVSDVIKARQLATQGLTDSRGGPIIPQAQIAPSTPWLKGIGFNPEQTALAYDQRAAVREFTEEVNARRQAALDQWLNNRDASAIRAYNMDRAFNHGDVINMQDMQNALARRQNQLKSQRTLGVAVGPRLLPGAMAAGRF